MAGILAPSPTLRTQPGTCVELLREAGEEEKRKAALWLDERGAWPRTPRPRAVRLPLGDTGQPPVLRRPERGVCRVPAFSSGSSLRKDRPRGSPVCLEHGGSGAALEGPVP